MITESKDKELREALKNLRAFNDKALTLGIPTKFFGGAVGTSIIFAVMVSVPFGFLCLALTVIPLYIIHKNDSEAATLYISEFLSSDRFTHDLKIDSGVVILSDDLTKQSLSDISLQRKMG